jgi:hypothetical protein
MASSTGLTHLDRVPAEQEGHAAATAGRVVWLSHGRCFRGDAQAYVLHGLSPALQEGEHGSDFPKKTKKRSYAPFLSMKLVVDHCTLDGETVHLAQGLVGGDTPSMLSHQLTQRGSFARSTVTWCPPNV